MRGNDPHGRVPHRRGEHLRGPGRRAAALADRKQRANERTHHVVAERVRDHAANRHTVGVARPLQAAQRPHGRRPLPLAAERGEVMLPEQQRRRLIHGGKVQVPRIPERVMPPQRIRPRRVIADPVRVPPPERREPRVKPVGRHADGAHPEVRRQRPRQPPQRRVRVRGPGIRGQVSVRHLAARVHTGISPPGHGKAHGGRQPQHVPERLRQHALDGPPPGLRRPPREPGPVIGEINPDPHERVTNHAGLLTTIR